jgi:hypothetical protein
MTTTATPAPLLTTDEFLSTLTLKSGAHPTCDDGSCAMEAVVLYRRRVLGVDAPWCDHDETVCPVIGAFVRSWNDGIADDATRTRLLAPFTPRLVGSRSTPAVEKARSLLALDWLVREFLPTWLEQVDTLRREFLPTWLEQVDTLRSLAVALRARPAVSEANAAEAGGLVRAARAAAGDAAWDAARAAAWDAAWAAAWAAARAAAGDALRPTVERLQASASDLVTRMLAVTPEVAQ